MELPLCVEMRPLEFDRSTTEFRGPFIPGRAAAQEELAAAYFWGDGVARDHSEAAEWFRT
jgi:hypothetical protein